MDRHLVNISKLVLFNDLATELNISNAPWFFGFAVSSSYTCVACTRGKEAGHVSKQTCPVWREVEVA